jgi:hypothetical protein
MLTDKKFQGIAGTEERAVFFAPSFWEFGEGEGEVLRKGYRS